MIRTALGALALVFFSSCAAERVEGIALFEPAQLTWPAVENDLHRGLEDAAEDGDLTEAAADSLRSEGAKLERALAEQSREGVRKVAWLSMEPFADRGIDDKLGDGEIGPGVAQSLREQLRNFTATITRLQEIEP